MDAGIVGAVIGSAAGLAGGAVGCYYSVTNAKGSLAKRFMLRCSVAMFVVVVLVVAGMFLVPTRLRWLVFVLWMLVLPVVITAVNRKLAKLEGEASTVL